MATTGIVGGTAVTVKVGGAFIAHTTSASVSATQETRNTTTKDSGKYTDILPTRISYEVSVEGMVAYDAAQGYEELWTSMDGQTAVTLLWGTHVAGDPSYTGSAYVTSLSKDASLDDNATFSCTFMVTGGVTVGTFV